MDYVDIQAVESKLTDVTVTPIPMIKNAHTNHSTGGRQQQQQLWSQSHGQHHHYPAGKSS
ncbi:uncharacterized protein LOC121601085 [Anopheles merus]|uniref:uncharacterized protein LOC121601085 n=1 Tax=Anopheles merus TaxID=30066 RepID=UPI001BE462C0|nr:uncharacterized protein LOC121601085 [Anopheles merus]